MLLYHPQKRDGLFGDAVIAIQLYSLLLVKNDMFKFLTLEYYV